MNMKYALRSEDTEQINVISWASWQMQKYPELKWLHHIPNGGSRNRAEAIKLKQMGVKSGVSDLCLPYPKGIYCGLYIEMKYDKGRHQPSQKEFLTDMAAAGHYVATCYTARDAVEVLEKYLNLKCLQTHIHVSDSDTAVTETAERMKEQNNSVWKDGEVKPLKVQDMNGYAAAVRQFYDIYRPIARKYGLRMSSHTSIYDDG